MSTAGPYRNLECEELIFNGDFSNSIEGWRVRTGNTLEPAVLAGGALKTNQRSAASFHTIEQYLDTSCMMAGDVFSFSARYRRVDSDGLNVIPCEDGIYSSKCVSATIQRTIFDAATGDLSHSYLPLARTDLVDTSSAPFYKMEGEWTVTETDVAADRSSVYFSGGEADLILDDTCTTEKNTPRIIGL